MKSAFSLGSQERITNISNICHEQKVWKWSGRQLIVLIPKNHLFRVFFCGFLRNRYELMVPGQPPNTHPRSHIMQKEPTDFLNFPTRDTISGVQNVTLYCKINTVIHCSYGYTNGHWPKGYTEHLIPCFYNLLGIVVSMFVIQQVPGSTPGYILEIFLEVQGLEWSPPSLVIVVVDLRFFWRVNIAGHWRP